MLNIILSKADGDDMPLTSNTTWINICDCNYDKKKPTTTSFLIDDVSLFFNEPAMKIIIFFICF
jgi:hypothetical protein